jgi:chloramphenicol-sensitive protein RarD
MPAARLAGFALVWLALIIFTVDGIRGARSAGQTRRAERRRATEEAAADATAATAASAPALPPR